MQLCIAGKMSRRVCVSTRGADAASCAVYCFTECARRQVCSYASLEKSLAARTQARAAWIRHHVLCIESRNPHDLHAGYFRCYASLEKCPAARAQTRAAWMRDHAMCIDSRMLDNFAAMDRWENVPPRVRKHARRGYMIMCCVLIHGMHA